MDHVYADFTDFYRILITTGYGQRPAVLNIREPIPGPADGWIYRFESKSHGTVRVFQTDPTLEFATYTIRDVNGRKSIIEYNCEKITKGGGQ